MCVVLAWPIDKLDAECLARLLERIGSISERMGQYGKVEYVRGSHVVTNVVTVIASNPHERHRHRA